MNEVLEKIQKIGIVPVVVLDDAKDAAPLAKALCEGGLPCAEVTFRTAAAEESIPHHGEGIPGYVSGRRHSPHHRAGGPRSERRSKIHRKPRSEPHSSKILCR